MLKKRGEIKACGNEEGNLTEGKKKQKMLGYIHIQSTVTRFPDKYKWSLIAVNKTFIKGIARKYNWVE